MKRTLYFGLEWKIPKWVAFQSLPLIASFKSAPGQIEGKNCIHDRWVCTHVSVIAWYACTIAHRSCACLLLHYWVWICQGVNCKLYIYTRAQGKQRACTSDIANITIYVYTWHFYAHSHANFYTLTLARDHEIRWRQGHAGSYGKLKRVAPFFNLVYDWTEFDTLKMRCDLSIFRPGKWKEIFRCVLASL